MSIPPDLLTAEGSSATNTHWIVRWCPGPSQPATKRVIGEQILRTEGLVKTYGKRTVVNQVEINVHRGEIVGLLGPNGAGKTTSFYMIVGLVPPTAGHINFNGNDVTRLPMFRRAPPGHGLSATGKNPFSAS